MTLANNSSIPGYAHRKLTGTNIAVTNNLIDSGGSFNTGAYTLSGGAAWGTGQTSIRLPDLGAKAKQESFTPVVGGRNYLVRFKLVAGNIPHSSLGVHPNTRGGSGSSINQNVQRITCSAANTDEEILIPIAIPAGHSQLRINFFNFEEAYDGSSNSAELLQVKQLEIIAIEDMAIIGGNTAPSQRRAFGTSHIRISRRGDFYVNEGGFKEIQIRGIYKRASSPNYSDYAAKGFNTTYQVGSAIDAVSSANAGLYYFYDLSGYATRGDNRYGKDSATIISELSGMVAHTAFSKCIGWYIDYENTITKEYSRILQIMAAVRTLDTDRPFNMLSAHPYLLKRFDQHADMLSVYMNPSVQSNGVIRPEYTAGAVVSHMSSTELPIGVATYNQAHEYNEYQDDMLVAVARGFKHFTYWKDGSPVSDISSRPWYSGIAATHSFMESLKSIIGERHDQPFYTATTYEGVNTCIWGGLVANGERYLILANNTRDTKSTPKLTLDATVATLTDMKSSSTWKTLNSEYINIGGIPSQESRVLSLGGGSTTPTPTRTPPRFDDLSLPQMIVGTAYDVSLVPNHVRDATVAGLKLTSITMNTATLPPGVSYDSTNWRLHGTPTHTGSGSLQVTANWPADVDTSGSVDGVLSYSVISGGTTPTDPGTNSASCKKGKAFSSSVADDAGSVSISGDTALLNMTAFRNGGQLYSGSPQAIYDFVGLAPGQQYVWLRVTDGTAGLGADSCHLFVNDDFANSIEVHFPSASSGTTRYVLARDVVVPASGVLTVNVAGREPGSAQINNICVSTSNTDPTAAGPSVDDPFAANDINVSPVVQVSGPVRSINLLSGITNGTATVSCVPEHGVLGSGEGNTGSVKRGTWVLLAGDNHLSDHGYTDTNENRGKEMKVRIQEVIARKQAGLPIAGVFIRDAAKQFVNSGSVASATTLPSVDKPFMQILRDEIIPLLKNAGIGCAVQPHLRAGGATLTSGNPLPSYFASNGWAIVATGGSQGNVVMPNMNNTDSAVALGSVYEAMGQYFDAGSGIDRRDAMQFVNTHETTAGSNAYGSINNHLAWYFKWMEVAKAALPDGLPLINCNFIDGGNSSFKKLFDEAIRIGGIGWTEPDTRECWFARANKTCNSGYGVKNTGTPANLYNYYYDNYKGKLPFFPFMEMRDLVVRQGSNGNNTSELNELLHSMDWAYETMDAIGCQVLYDGWSSDKSGSNGPSIEVSKYVILRDAAIHHTGGLHYTGSIDSLPDNVGGGGSVIAPIAPFADASIVVDGDSIIYTPSTDPYAAGQTDTVRFCLTPTGLSERGYEVNISYGGTPPTGSGSGVLSPTCFSKEGVVGEFFSASVYTQGQPSGVVHSTPEGIPRGLSISAGTGLISGTPMVAGLANFKIRATLGDEFKEISCNFITIDNATGNHPPGIPNCIGGEAIQGIPYSSTINSVDQDGDPVTLSISSGTLPTGLVLNGNQVTGTPTVLGSSVFTIKATDDQGLSSSVACGVTIVKSPIIQQPDSGPAQGGTVGSNYEFDFLPVGNNITFKLDSGTLPPGIVIGSTSMLGVPTQEGTYNFSIVATDSINTSTPTFYTVVIASAATNQAPVIIGFYSNGTQDVAYDSSVAVNEPEGDTYAVTLLSGSIPAGTELVSNGLIRGTPTGVGTSNFVIKATDQFGNSSTSVQSITILAPTTGGGGTIGQPVIYSPNAFYMAMGDITLKAIIPGNEAGASYAYAWSARQNGIPATGVVFSPANGETTIASAPAGGQYDVICTITDGVNTYVALQATIVFVGSGTTNGVVIGSDLTINL